MVIAACGDRSRKDDTGGVYGLVDALHVESSGDFFDEHWGHLLISQFLVYNQVYFAKSV
jgi:hypothetical protein